MDQHPGNVTRSKGSTADCRDIHITKVIPTPSSNYYNFYTELMTTAFIMG